MDEEGLRLLKAGYSELIISEHKQSVKMPQGDFTVLYSSGNSVYIQGEHPTA